MASETDIAVLNGTDQVHLVATNSIQMEYAKADLAKWLQSKLGSIDTDIVDFNRSIGTARNNNWDYSGLSRLRNKAVADQEFYAKLLAAVEAGYTIIPDFPIDVFAIRVGRFGPTGQRTVDRWQPPVYAQPADLMEVGIGEYVNPFPSVIEGTIQGTDLSKQPITLKTAQPWKFKDVVFPLRAARPEVMDATAQAMALKIFDQVGICPAEKKADPLIIGQVLHKKTPSGQKRVNFLIAWHLNLKEL